jgi:glycosyltransferase involved in cell wall biosynthesis
LRVLILNIDASNNAIATSAVLWSLLAPDHEVEVWAYDTGNGRWPGLPAGMPLRLLDRLPVRDLARARFDVCIVGKPLGATFGLALATRPFAPWRRLVLELDDHEPTLRRPDHGDRPLWRRAIRNGLSLRDINSWPWALLHERLIGRADALIATSPALARRFGAVWIPPVKDPEQLSGGAESRARGRAYLEAGDDRLVVFAGTPHFHKGLEDLAAAVSPLTGTRLVLAGSGGDQRLVRALIERYPAVEARTVTWKQLPDVLAAADVVAVPQRDDPVAQWQLPFKILDAMAAGRPIVATRVPNVEETLEGVAELVPPRCPDALREAIKGLLDDPERARLLGQRARARATAEFAPAPVSERLVSVLQGRR